jgi:hypothetical protein
MEARHNRPKSPPAPASPDAKQPETPAPSINKEPTAEELSDEHLDHLFKNDPSEYERLAKIREKRDPTFKMKKEE